MAQLGFIGLGNMGAPMATRLLDAGYPVTVFDNRDTAVDRMTALGAVAAASVADVALAAETVLMSLPTPAAAEAVTAQLRHGAALRRVIDLSTIGSQAAQRNRQVLAAAGIALLDCPVSGGVHGAQAGTLALMVSGIRSEFDAVTTLLETLGRPIFVGEQPGAAQTMKLVNNLMAATTLAATAEVTVMGVKSGLDAAVLIDVLNAGSGATHASRDKFPRAVLPRTFDYGFATGLMVKDLHLYLQEARALGLPTALAEAVVAVWDSALRDQGPESDFTTVIKPMEAAAGVLVGREVGKGAGKEVGGPANPARS